MVPGPVKVALWPLAMPNVSKLWNRLAPAAEVRADLDPAAAQADPGADRAVGDDLRLDRPGGQQRREQRWAKPVGADPF
jgi:hypothetical protein